MNAPMPSAGGLCAVGQGHLLLGVGGVEAVPRLALRAGAALTADRAPVQHHEVARLHLGDPFADGLHPSGGLVAEQERELVVDATFAVVQIGVADPAGLDRDDRFTGTGIRHNDVDHFHRSALAAGDDTFDGLGHLRTSSRFRHLLELLPRQPR